MYGSRSTSTHFQPLPDLVSNVWRSHARGERDRLQSHRKHTVPGIHWSRPSESQSLSGNHAVAGSPLALLGPGECTGCVTRDTELRGTIRGRGRGRGQGREYLDAFQGIAFVNEALKRPLQNVAPDDIRSAASDDAEDTRARDGTGPSSVRRSRSAKVSLRAFSARMPSASAGVVGRAITRQRR